MTFHPSPTTADAIVVFDYSGTLSAGAVAFGRPEALEAALARSGVAAAGIRRAADYWEGIVTPTWIAASVSPHPFARTIADRMRRLAPGLPAPRAEAAAERFMAAYMAASTIDAAWQPVLRRLCTRTDARVVVATDHYREATGALIGHLEGMGLRAAPLQDAAPACDVRVANSADLGCHKVDAAFWRRVAAAAGAGARKLVLVDDFGAGEADTTDFALPQRVRRRRERTLAAMRRAADWAVHLLAFAPDDPGAVAAVEGRLREILDAR